MASPEDFIDTLTALAGRRRLDGVVTTLIAAEVFSETDEDGERSEVIELGPSASVLDAAEVYEFLACPAARYAAQWRRIVRAS